MIKFEDSFEDQIGCPYNLSKRDEEWLDRECRVELRSRIPDLEFEKTIHVLDRLGDKVSYMSLIGRLNL